MNNAKKHNQPQSASPSPVERDLGRGGGSFSHAFRGICKAFAAERNMRIHALIALLVVVCGFIFNISRTEWMLCVLCFGLVFGAELINSAVERVVDLASPDRHESAKNAKDMSAGAVLVCAVFSAVVGLIIFVPKVWVLIF